MAVPSFPETTIICDEAILDGKISFGDNNIIHPKCTIVSEGGGDIIFGDNNIIEENVYIVNKYVITSKLEQVRNVEESGNCFLLFSYLPPLKLQKC